MCLNILFQIMAEAVTQFRGFEGRAILEGNSLGETFASTVKWDGLAF